MHQSSARRAPANRTGLRFMRPALSTTRNARFSPSSYNSVTMEWERGIAHGRKLVMPLPPLLDGGDQKRTGALWQIGTSSLLVTTDPDNKNAG